MLVSQLNSHNTVLSPIRYTSRYNVFLFEHLGQLQRHARLDWQSCNCYRWKHWDWPWMRATASFTWREGLYGLKNGISCCQSYWGDPNCRPEDQWSDTFLEVGPGWSERMQAICEGVFGEGEQIGYFKWVALTVSPLSIVVDAFHSQSTMRGLWPLLMNSLL